MSDVKTTRGTKKAAEVDCECPLYIIEGGRDMEHAEGNRKIVLKVLSTLLIMYILTGVALFVLAFLLYKMELTENIVTIGITAIYVVSGLLGGIIIGKRMKTRRFLWGIIMGAAYFLVLLIGSALLNRGLTSDMLHIGLTLVMCMGAGMIGGMVS